MQAGQGILTGHHLGRLPRTSSGATGRLLGCFVCVGGGGGGRLSLPHVHHSGHQPCNMLLHLQCCLEPETWAHLGPRVAEKQGRLQRAGACWQHGRAGRGGEAHRRADVERHALSQDQGVRAAADGHQRRCCSGAGRCPAWLGGCGGRSAGHCCWQGRRGRPNLLLVSSPRPQLAAQKPRALGAHQPVAGFGLRGGGPAAVSPKGCTQQVGCCCRPPVLQAHQGVR